MDSTQENQAENSASEVPLEIQATGKFRRNGILALLAVIGLGVGGYTLPRSESKQNPDTEIQALQRDAETKQEIAELKILLEKIGSDVADLKKSVDKLDQRQWEQRTRR